LIPELEALGHEAIAVELPGHGSRQQEQSTLDGYRQAVLDVLRPGDMLVGHSMGCPVATMAADAFPDIAHVVFLAGPLPVEGRPLIYEMGDPKDQAGGPETSDGDVNTGLVMSDDGFLVCPSIEVARTVFYHDCPDETVQWAFDRLSPQSIEVLVGEPVSVPRFWTSDVSRSFIRCSLDRALLPEIADRTAQRLGVEPLVIESSHSPFLSRPRELARVIIEALDTQPVRPIDSIGPGPSG